MSHEIERTDTYEALVEEIKATFVERVFNAREEVIRAHHETGKLIHTFLAEHKGVKVTLLVKRLEQEGAGKETTLWLSHEFYKKFPNLDDIDELGHGKNISWNKIRKLLAPPQEGVPVIKEVKVEVTKELWSGVRMANPKEGDTISFTSTDGKTKVFVTISEV